MADPKDLEKGWKDAVLAVGLGAGVASAQVPQAQAPKAQVQEVKQPPVTNEHPFKPDTLHPEMHPIAFAETSYGKNMSHAKHPLGDWETAKGALGLKPSTAYDEFTKSKHLSALYPEIKTKDDFSTKLKDSDFYNLVAGTHWNRLKRVTGSKTGAAYAWRWGATAFKNATPEQVASEPYVLNYVTNSETQPWVKKAKPANPANLQKNQESLEKNVGFVKYKGLLPEGMKQKSAYVPTTQSRYNELAGGISGSPGVGSGTAGLAIAPRRTKRHLRENRRNEENYGANPSGIEEKHKGQSLLTAPASYVKYDNPIDERHKAALDALNHAAKDGQGTQMRGFVSAGNAVDAIHTRTRENLFPDFEGIHQTLRELHDRGIVNLFDGTSSFENSSNKEEDNEYTPRDKHGNKVTHLEILQPDYQFSGKEVVPSLSDQKQIQSTSQHEAQHGVHQQLTQKYGQNSRSKVLETLFENLHPVTGQVVKEIRDWMEYQWPEMYGDLTEADSNDEVISQLQSYLISPRKRALFELGVDSQRRADFLQKAKFAFQNIREVADRIVPHPENPGEFVVNPYKDSNLRLSETEDLEPLAKTTQMPGFPKLADPRDAGSVAQVNTPRQYSIAKLALGFSKKPTDEYGATRAEASQAYAKGTDLTSKFGQIGTDPKLQAGISAHEKFHLYMNQIEQKHGLKARLNLAENLHSRIPEDARKHLDELTKKRAPKQTSESAPKFHEERIAHLLNYLNVPEERLFAAAHVLKLQRTDPVLKQVVSGTGDMNDPKFAENLSKFREFDNNMKLAFRTVQRASKNAGSHMLKKPLPAVAKPFLFDPNESFRKSETLDLTDAELGALESYTSLFDSESKEFEMASFLAGGYKPTQEDIHFAMLEHEGDLISAALCSHKLPVTEDYKAKLLIMCNSDLQKAEIETLQPAKVKPFDHQAGDFAALAQEAYNSNQVKLVSLGGKHSAGSALFNDPTGKVWFLKPGSGGISSAKGVSEEQASASRREVAFNLIAQAVGLGKFVPKAGLLLVNGKETAMLEFFTGDFRPINKIRKEKDLKTVFGQFVESSILHRVAVLDYLLGQTDRHAGNVLSDSAGNFKLIDAGSAFAGDSFNPAFDPKSFIPVYLRAFTQRSFKTMTPTERLAVMPKLGDRGEASLDYWVKNLPIGKIVELLHRYGINTEPVVTRFKALIEFQGKKSDFITKFWSGVSLTQPSGEQSLEAVSVPNVH